MACYTPQELVALGFQIIGKNVRVSTRASFYGAERISLGSDVRIDDFCVLSAGEGGIEIGSYVHVAVMAALIGRGRITIGDFCNISGRVSIYSSSDDYSGRTMTNPTVPAEYKNVTDAPVILGKHVIVGAGSVVLPGVTIGDGAAVGALSLVNRDLEPFGVYAGSPIRRLKDRSRRLLDLEREFLGGTRSGLAEVDK